MRTKEDGALLVLLIAISLAFAWILWPFYGAILWAIVFATVFAPAHRRVLASMRQNPNLAALTTLLLIVTIVLFPLTLTAMSVVQEVIGSLRVVKAFGQERREHERFVDESARGIGARLRVIKWECLFGICVGLITAAGTATVLYVGAEHVQRGVLSLGELLLVMAYLAQLYEPLKSLSKTATALQKSLTGAERTFALLDRTHP